MSDISVRPLFRLFLAAEALFFAGAAHAAIEISSKPTHGVSCSGGICTATSRKAVLNVGDLETMLAAADVSVVSGNAAKDIMLRGALTWASPSRLTLDSWRAITFGKPVDVAGTGALTIVTNDGGSGGDYVFLKSGRVRFLDVSASLVINANAYTLVNSVASLAAAVESNAFARYALADDYDAKADGKYGATVVPTPLAGIFEGLGNTVSKLRFVQNPGAGQAVGFFDTVEEGAVVRDFAMTRADLTSVNRSSGDRAGMLAVINAGTIAHVYTQGVIHGRSQGSTAGGLVDENFGTISDSSTAVSIIGGGVLGMAGGVAALNKGSIGGCSATGSVSAIMFAGGLVGENDGAIVNSHATGAIDSQAAGGLVSSNGAETGTITNSFATGAVAGLFVVGGLASGNFGVISSSYATGAVANTAATGEAGGLVGVNDDGTIENSYATGAVTNLDPSSAAEGGLIGDNRNSNTASIIQGAYSTGHLFGPGKIGGFIGLDEQPPGHTGAAYWDLDTSGVSDPSRGAGSPPNDAGITGLSDVQLKAGLPVGFDPAIWAQNPVINNGYPYLLALPPG